MSRGLSLRVQGTVYLFNGGQLTACHSEHEIFVQFALIADEKIELGILSPEFRHVFYWSSDQGA